MSLVWLGMRVEELRGIRAKSVGAERAPDSDGSQLSAKLLSGFTFVERLASRERNMLARYAEDVDSAIREASRVLRPGGKAVYVVANSCVRTVFVENSEVVKRWRRDTAFSLLGNASASFHRLAATYRLRPAGQTTVTWPRG
jgi:hypothetical protein